MANEKKETQEAAPGWKPKTKGQVTLAHNVVDGDRLFRAGQSYPIGQGAAEVKPAWLKAEPHMDLDHPDCQESLRKQAEFRRRLEEEARKEKGKQDLSDQFAGKRLRRRVGIA